MRTANPHSILRMQAACSRDCSGMFSVIGEKLIHEITAPEVLDMIRMIEARGAFEISRRAKQGVPVRNRVRFGCK